ncbi:MAG: arginine--tRNA ligase [Patescibacteria group bacterium]|jgi:arginyl-tRNA synthetase
MRNIVKAKIDLALKSLGFNLPGYSVDEPPSREMGDYSTNVAMVASGLEKKNPREIAQKIQSELSKDPEIESVEIAGPGFINIALKSDLYTEELSKILEEGSKYGSSEIGKGKTINVEYVSANPTGPLHIGNARSGPIGEAVANLFEFNSYGVTKEFYVNDIGVQIGRFGKSLFHWCAIKSDPKIEFPEGGYPGEYIQETSEKIQKEFGDEIAHLDNDQEKIDFFARKGLNVMVANIKSDLELAGINIHTFSYESKIINSGKSKIVIDRLKEKGFVAEKDGAVWFKNPEDPDLMDNDAVLAKSDEEKSLTYFANDIAYHLDKIDRGADKLFDIWGANHFGHIPRMKAALRALGCPDETLEIVLYQYVRLKKSGVASSMGKRLGNFVTLRAVIEAGVEADAFKYFILSQNANTPMDFDIELAAEKSEKNPVYYIKYAHARICSILKKIEEQGTPLRQGFAGQVSDQERGDLSLLKDEKEIALYKELVKFPEIVEETLVDFQTQRLPHFAYKIAALFHDFYNSCSVIDAGSKELVSARLSLIIATKNILANTLKICGIKAPEKM